MGSTGRKVVGRKQNMLVDTLELLMSVLNTPIDSIATWVEGILERETFAPHAD